MAPLPEQLPEKVFGKGIFNPRKFPHFQFISSL